MEYFNCGDLSKEVGSSVFGDEWKTSYYRTIRPTKLDQILARQWYNIRIFGMMSIPHNYVAV